MNYIAIPGIKECYREDIMSAGVKAQRIIDKVCDYFNISYEMMVLRVRRKNTIMARQWAVHFLRMNTKLTLLEIAALLGYPEHSSVIHCSDTIREQINAKHPNRYKEDYKLLVKII